MTFGKMALVLAAGLFLGAATATPPRDLSAFRPMTVPPARFDGTLSVLTYNVEGLPFPVRIGRASAMAAIVAELRAMRASQDAPHVIVLQEAFMPEAQAIGAAAGYRYRAAGPAAAATNAAPMTAGDRIFAAGARWWKGETAGKLVGSGLAVLSDYPIVATRRMAFPAFACAGFDCLANKGALLVSVAVPGIATPVDIVTTHLNSRHASHVPTARANAAYFRQVAALDAFIAAGHDPRRPLIVAGDFNVGKEALRRATLLGGAAVHWHPSGRVADALHEAGRLGLPLPADALFSLNRARDWQFFAAGSRAGLALTGLTAPFGRDADGRMLSDHVGYVADFRFVPPPSAGETLAATRNARSRA